MSIYNRFDREQAGGVLVYRGGETCFHCHQAVWADNAIEWHGSDDQNEVTNLLFHPGCAIEFAIRLLRDVHIIEVREGVAVYLKKGAK